jgi:MoaA/NifB/PqqE/SkfB family radical SAM enzyme
MHKPAQQVDGTPVDPKAQDSKVSALPPRLLLDLATLCNLHCPQCPVWGSGRKEDIKKIVGVMDVDNYRRILDEIMQAPALVVPNLYGEPLLAPNIGKRITEMKSRGISVAINTNGLALTPELADFFVAVGLDSIFFSLDAMSPETLEKVRGIRDIHRLEVAVEMMLRARGEKSVPRIGVSFNEQPDNLHEREAFVAHWGDRVDCVRVGLHFKDGRFASLQEPAIRKPCPAIYTTIPINHNGTANICCLDCFQTTNMGNVFADGGVEAVWKGQAFTQVRYLHETGQWDKLPLCRHCNGWAQYEFTEEIRGDFLIRQSPQFVYYNKIDKLDNWNGALLGGHSVHQKA